MEGSGAGCRDEQVSGERIKRLLAEQPLSDDADSAEATTEQLLARMQPAVNNPPRPPALTRSTHISVENV